MTPQASGSEHEGLDAAQASCGMSRLNEHTAPRPIVFTTQE